jgi:hypothetical protein
MVGFVFEEKGAWWGLFLKRREYGCVWREEKGAWLGLVLEEKGAWMGLVLEEKGVWLCLA